MAEGRPGLLGPRSPPGPAPSTCLAGILSMSRLNPRLAGRWPLNDQGGPSGAACAQGSVFPGPQGPQRPLRPGSPHTSWVTVTPPLPGKQGWSHTGKTIPGPGDPRLEADCQSGTRRVSGRAALTHNVGLRSPRCQQEGSAQPSLLQLRDQVRSRPWSCGGRGGGLRGELGAGQGGSSTNLLGTVPRHRQGSFPYGTRKKGGGGAVPRRRAARAGAYPRPLSPPALRPRGQWLPAVNENPSGLNENVHLNFTRRPPCALRSKKSEEAPGLEEAGSPKRQADPSIPAASECGSAPSSPPLPQGPKPRSRPTCPGLHPGRGLRPVAPKAGAFPRQRP